VRFVLWTQILESAITTIITIIIIIFKKKGVRGYVSLLIRRIMKKIGKSKTIIDELVCSRIYRIEPNIPSDERLDGYEVYGLDWGSGGADVGVGKLGRGGHDRPCALGEYECPLLVRSAMIWESDNAFIITKRKINSVTPTNDRGDLVRLPRNESIPDGQTSSGDRGCEGEREGE